MRRVLLCTALLTIVAAPALRAQAPAAQAGERERAAATAAACEPATGVERCATPAARAELALAARDPFAGYQRDLADRLERRRGVGSYRLIGAGVGLVVGGGVTFAVLHSGGSSSLCDRDANQDAMSAGECAGLTVLGGLTGAALGAVVGGLLHR